MIDTLFFIPSPHQATANPQAVFTFPQVRFTLLSSQMLRVEVSPNGQFEDRPTQAFWYRNQALPGADINHTPDALSIKTDWLNLMYRDSSIGITPETLQVTLTHNHQILHLDDPNPGLFPGTTRTLDMTNGPISLQPGFFSREGWTQIEDTASLVFTAQGWLEARPNSEGYRDIYLLVYGQDYPAGLAAYQTIGGRPPLLPRAFLGNWWSRYWAYSQKDLHNLVQKFQDKQIPLSVLIIDMDWHITETGNACSGWTGFSWNRALFPDPPALMHWLHQQKLITSLNLHPAEGIHPHEERYTQAALAMGQDPQQRLPIPFNIADPKFAKTYFEELIHPLEGDGVDFWWLDWQQGKRTKLQGLDPLWALNHLHFHDLARKVNRRPVIFSRWGGPGNQRYPIGFSGDTYISWKSLAFQPYFTASAANAAYGWWSHDIGGHMHGIEDADLYTRWVQFGVLSPIFRLHCAKDTLIDHAPWAFDAQVEENVRQAMQFRHALVPYLYSMARRNEQSGLPLVTPLYYDWPQEEMAYLASSQYRFGSQLMAAPVTTPLLPTLQHSRQAIWFPQGQWFDFFTGECHIGAQWEITYQHQEDIPLFARAGAIIPLQSDVTTNGCANPQNIDLLIFPGADGQFDLYEDNGVTQAYLQTGGCTTRFSSTWQASSMRVSVHPAFGETSVIPSSRNYRILLRGIRPAEHLQLTVDGKSIPVDSLYNTYTHTLEIGPLHLHHDQQLDLQISTTQSTLLAPPAPLADKIRRFLLRCKMSTDSKHLILKDLETLPKDPGALDAAKYKLSAIQKLALMELISGCAAISLESPLGGNHTVLINSQQLDGFSYQSDAEIFKVPFELILPKQKHPIMMNYFGVLKKKL